MKTCNACCRSNSFGQQIKDEQLSQEEVLKVSDGTLSKIVNILTDSVVIINDRFKIIWGNDAAQKLFGTDLVGKSYHGVFYKTGKCYPECILQKCFLDGNSHDMEVQIANPEGESLDLWCTVMVASRYPDGRPQKVIKICRDITDMKAYQSEAMRNAHLASLGELTGGIAHEINNPITGILNYAQILIDQCDGDDQEAEIPRRIMHEGERIATTIRWLLSFVGDQKKEKLPVQIKSVLMDTLNLTRTVMRKDNIQIDIDIPDQFPVVSANPQQLQLVFLNIMSNARYALNKKYADANPDKLMRISARVIDEDEGRRAQIIFNDHGIGIPSDIINKIQVPFFSTKPRGHATGLGLSISHSLIKEHGGKLWFESIEGKYTKAVIELLLES